MNCEYNVNIVVTFVSACSANRILVPSGWSSPQTSHYPSVNMPSVV